MNALKTLLLALFFLHLNSCVLFESKQTKGESLGTGVKIARVKDQFFYEDQLPSDITYSYSSKEDSISRIKSIIDQWATGVLMRYSADLNLNQVKKDEIDLLTEQYRQDLIVKSYIEDFVTREIDTIVSQAQIDQYYAKYKTNFKTSKPLYRFRFLSLSSENSTIDLFREYIRRFNKEDQAKLEDNTLIFKDFFLNDSLWVDQDQVIESVDFITFENKNEFLVSQKEFVYKDSLTTWIGYVCDKIEINHSSPKQFVSSTVKQIILNQRKIKFIKKLKEEITKEAIKNKEYEIF